MNANQRTVLNDTAPDVIARLSIGVEACGDNIGSICVANRGNGFGVFINGGVLPDGDDERFFPATDVRCLDQAYAFALSVAQDLIAEEVQFDSITVSGEDTGPTTPKYPAVCVRSSHTPAPWRYEASTKTIRAVPTNYWLASMDSWDGAVNHVANAQLIAAAPELLAMLRACVGAIEALIAERPMLAAKLAGSTTLGNHVAEAKGVIVKAEVR